MPSEAVSIMLVTSNLPYLRQRAEGELRGGGVRAPAAVPASAPFGERLRLLLHQRLDRGVVVELGAADEDHRAARL
jgi:hypothetical protein